MLGFQEQGPGRGQGITSTEVEQAKPRPAIDTRPPCGCASNMTHLTSCETANSQRLALIRSLPEQMPVSPLVLDVVPDGVVVNIPSCKVSPKELRAIARKMLTRADESERADVA